MFSVSPVEFTKKNTLKRTERLNKIQTLDSIDTIKCQQNVLSFNADAPEEKCYGSTAAEHLAHVLHRENVS